MEAQKIMKRFMDKCAAYQASISDIKKDFQLFAEELFLYIDKCVKFPKSWLILDQ